VRGTREVSGETREVLIASVVGYGPVRELAAALAAKGIGARVVALFGPDEWRAQMAAFGVARMRARVGSLITFPLHVIAESVRSRGSIVVPTTNPFPIPVIAVATKWLHGNTVIPLVYDLFPDALEAVGATARGGLVDRLATLLNRWWLERADGVVFIGQAMADHACRRYATPRHWTVIETGADAAVFADAGGPEPESELERWCEGKTVIAYVGNFGHVHDWETLAEAIPRLVRTRDDVGVVVAASGPGVIELKRRWAALPIESVRFEAPLGHRPWARLLARTGISVSTLRQGASQTSIPSKTFSAMAAGAAIVAVAPPASDLAALVERHACGVVVAPGDVDGLLGALTRLLDEPSELQHLRMNAASAARDVFDMPILAQRWASFLLEVTRGRQDDVASRAEAPAATGAGVRG
jgi:glycosyltransferase involved in cell wall biosynthesis